MSMFGMKRPDSTAPKGSATHNNGPALYIPGFNPQKSFPPKSILCPTWEMSRSRCLLLWFISIFFYFNNNNNSNNCKEGEKQKTFFFPPQLLRFLAMLKPLANCTLVVLCARSAVHKTRWPTWWTPQLQQRNGWRGRRLCWFSTGKYVNRKK